MVRDAWSKPSDRKLKLKIQRNRYLVMSNYFTDLFNKLNVADDIIYTQWIQNPSCSGILNYLVSRFMFIDWL